MRFLSKCRESGVFDGLSRTKGVWVNSEDLRSLEGLEFKGFGGLGFDVQGLGILFQIGFVSVSVPVGFSN